MDSSVDPVTSESEVMTDGESGTEDTSPSVHSPASTKTGQSRIISSVLSPAIRLWLRSQLEHVEDLQFRVEAGDRQLLTGAIQRIVVSARKAVYRGLHLSQVDLAGEQIRTNLGQMLRGKPLRLLEAFPVAGTVLLQEADMNASLQAPLLANAVIDFLLTILELDCQAESTAADPDTPTITLKDPQVRLTAQQITFTAALVSVSGKTTPVTLRTGLRIENGNELKLSTPQWLPHANARQGLPLTDLEDMTFHLGDHVALEQLSLEANQIICSGRIMVTPES